LRIHKKHMKIFIHYLSITACIDRATTGKVNFNISACSQAIGRKFKRLRVCLSGHAGDTAKSVKCQQNSKIQLCNYTNLKKDARLSRVNNAAMLFNEAYQS